MIHTTHMYDTYISHTCISTAIRSLLWSVYGRHTVLLFDKKIHTREIPQVCRYQGVKAGLELLQEEFGTEGGSESVCLWRLRPDSDTTCVCLLMPGANCLWGLLFFPWLRDVMYVCNDNCSWEQCHLTFLSLMTIITIL